MSLITFTKHPTASKNYVVDYSDWLATGETLVSADVSVADNTSTDPLLISHSVDDTNNLVILTVGGGVDGEQYQVIVEILTSTPQTEVQCVLFDILGEC